MLQLADEAKPQESGRAEVIAGTEQHAVLRAQLFDDVERRDRAAVARPANRASARRVPAERVTEGLEPRFHHWIVRVQDAPSALDQLVAHVGIERDRGEMIRRAGRPDEGEVVTRPDLLGEPGLS